MWSSTNWFQQNSVSNSRIALFRDRMTTVRYTSQNADADEMEEQDMAAEDEDRVAAIVTVSEECFRRLKDYFILMYLLHYRN